MNELTIREFVCDVRDNYPLREIDVVSLKNYLTDRNWKQVSFGRNEVMKFQSPHPLEEDKYLHILIPSTKELIDFDRITEIAIEAISAYEERNFEDVLSQILTFGNLFKINISSTHTKKGNKE